MDPAKCAFGKLLISKETKELAARFPALAKALEAMDAPRENRSVLRKVMGKPCSGYRGRARLRYAIMSADAVAGAGLPARRGFWDTEIIE